MLRTGRARSLSPSPAVSQAAPWARDPPPAGGQHGPGPGTREATEWQVCSGHSRDSGPRAEPEAGRREARGALTFLQEGGFLGSCRGGASSWPAAGWQVTLRRGYSCPRSPPSKVTLPKGQLSATGWMWLQRPLLASENTLWSAPTPGLDYTASLTPGVGPWRGACHEGKHDFPQEGPRRRPGRT